MKLSDGVPARRGAVADAGRCNGRDGDFESELKTLGNWGKACPRFESGKCLQFHLPVCEIEWSPDFPDKCRVRL